MRGTDGLYIEKNAWKPIVFIVTATQSSICTSIISTTISSAAIHNSSAYEAR